MRPTRPVAPRRWPEPIMFRECGCGGRMLPQTGHGRGRSLTYYRCETCGQPDYSTLGLETSAA